MSIISGPHNGTIPNAITTGEFLINQFMNNTDFIYHK